MEKNHIAKLCDIAMDIDEKKLEGNIKFGFVPTFFCQTFLPYRSPNTEQNFIFGDVTLEGAKFNVDLSSGKLQGQDVGLPFGSYPRMIIAYISSEVKKNNSKTIFLEKSLSRFMKKLGVHPTGGAKGTIKIFKDQLKRLRYCSYIITPYNQDGTLSNDCSARMDIIETFASFKDDDNWCSTIQVSENFFKTIVASMPIVFDALKQLSRSPQAMDIYCWITRKIWILLKFNRDKECISWGKIKERFGNFAPNTPTRIFKVRFVNQLKKVLIIYSDAKVDITRDDLIIYKSPLHVPIASKKPDLVSDSIKPSLRYTEEDKKNRIAYDKYRFKEALKNLVASEERKRVLSHFNDYRFRRGLRGVKNLESLTLNDHSILYNFLMSHYPCFLKGIISRNDFSNERIGWIT